MGAELTRAQVYALTTITNTRPRRMLRPFRHACPSSWDLGSEMLRRIWSIAILILAASRAAAHDDEITLRVIDGKLARGEGQATALLVRAEIERAEGRWVEAAADLDRAALLIPDSGLLALCRAGLAQDRGQPAEVLRV